MVEERLHRSTDIRRVIGVGTRAHGVAMVVHARRRDDHEPARWAVVAGRKVGSAVRRNRARRRLRALLRCEELPRGIDLVVVARAAAVDRDHAELADELGRLIPQALRVDAGAAR